MKNKSIIWVLAIFVIQVLTLIVLLDADLMRQIIRKEVAMMDEYYEPAMTNQIITVGNDYYETMIVDTGIEKMTYKMFIPPEYMEKGRIEDDQLQTNVFSFTYDRITALFESLRFSLIRLSSMQSWWQLTVLMLIGFFTSGRLIRKIKQENFDYTSPLRQEYSKRVMMFIPIVVWLTIWFPLPVSPLFYPSFAFLIALSMHVFVANTAKRV